MLSQQVVMVGEDREDPLLESVMALAIIVAHY